MNGIFKKTWTQTFTKSFNKWFFGSLSTLLGLLLLGKNLLGQTNVLYSIYIGAAVYAGILIIMLLVNGMQNTYYHLKAKYLESVYGEAIILLKDTFAHIHALRKKAIISDEDFKAAMITVCECLKKIYDKKTKGNCSVSIKVLKINDVGKDYTANTEVINLFRDQKSSNRDTTKYLDTKHYIFNNTCYNHIFNNILKSRKNKLYYLNNDIQSSKDYANSSIDAYASTEEEATKKILPYKSELVVPILPIINENIYNLLGFLCVDGNSNDIFDDLYDLAITQGVADGIYDIIKLKIES
ncbi:hypothetical protein BH10BAC2_BH10BAC2_29340 [soil metagenome]